MMRQAAERQAGSGNRRQPKTRTSTLDVVMNDVTKILGRIDEGDPTAADQLLPLVYNELRKLAAAKLSHERPGQTLQATALVHEAYLRLIGGDEANPWSGSRHFFAAAAEAMRRILIEQARRKNRLKRGGDRQRVPMSDLQVAAGQTDEDLLALDEALDRFAADHPEKAELVKLRYFAGFTIKQAAEVLEVSTTTADKWWAYARSWLRVELNSEETG